MEPKSNRIIVEVIINRPVAMVWKAWTTPEAIMQWNIPFENWHAPSVEIELKEGGEFCYRMEAKDSSEGFDHKGKYDRIIDKELIEYTLTDGRKSVIEFVSNGPITTVIESFDPETTNSIEMQRNFCQSVLNRFKNYAERAAPALNENNINNTTLI